MKLRDLTGRATPTTRRQTVFTCTRLPTGSAPRQNCVAIV
jgi:hypothetical protein